MHTTHFPTRLGRTVIALIALFALVAGCSSNPASAPAPEQGGAQPPPSAPGSPKKGGTLKVALNNEPVTLSSLMTGGDASMNKVRATMYDPLFHINYKDNTLVPLLAESMEQPSPTVYRVKIRKGVQFQKGYGELTAEDIAFSYNETIQKNLKSKFVLNFVKEVKVVDPYTVEFILDKPYSAFPITALAYGNMIVSKKAYTEMGLEKFNRNPISTGPFEFVEWVPGNRIVVKRFDSYWQKEKGLPYLDRIEFLIVKDDFVRANMLKTGQVDIADAPDLKDLDALQKEKGIVVKHMPGHNWDYISFNGKLKDSPFQNDKVRLAVNLALDRGQIAQDVYYGFATTTDSPTPPGFLGRPTNRIYADKPDVDRAKRLLAEAGYPNGLEVTVITSDKPNLRRELEIVADQLAKIGVKVKQQGLDLGTFNQRVQKSYDYVMALEDINIVSPDPDSAIFWFHYPDTTSWHGHSSPELNTLLEKGRALTKPEERDPVYKQIGDLVRQENWFIYLMHVDQVQAWKDYVQNFDIRPNEVRLYTDTWLNK